MDIGFLILFPMTLNILKFLFISPPYRMLQISSYWPTCFFNFKGYISIYEKNFF